MTTYDPELVERMVALVRHMADNSRDKQFMTAAAETKVVEDARAIVALLPPPVDPDLIEAREIVARGHDVYASESPWHEEQAKQVRSGASDRCFRVSDTLAGLKRGRELASERNQ